MAGMRARILAVCLSVATLLGAPRPAAAEDLEIKTFVWRVEPPRALGLRRKAPDRLLGTMHVPLRAGRRLPRAVEGWIRGATRFVMEVDVGTADPSLMRKYAALEQGQDLRALLPAPAWPKLVKHTASLGLDEAEVRTLDPWFVALTFMPTPADPGALMDSRLRGVAESARLPITYLEGAEEQVRALDSVAMKEDVAQLLEVVEDPAKPAAELATLTRAYETGDLPAVEAYLFDPERLRAYPDFYEKVFYKRNRNWLPALERTMRRDDAFVAVGLGHLLGDRGLLALLTKRGWRVTREPV